MPDKNIPALSAAQHAIHNLKQYRAGAAPFPEEALGILERFVAAAGDTSSAIWPNGCDTTAPKALRYLASNPRPAGGESHYNSEHLLQIAGELDSAVRNTRMPVTKEASTLNSMEAVFAKISDAELFAILTHAGRSDQLDYRLPGTSRSHKVTCAILEESDMARVRSSLLEMDQ